MKNKIKILLITLITIFILLGFAMLLNPPAGTWYQQFMPNLNGASIVGIQFTDSLMGYAITNLNPSSVSYFLKTSNGGDNWSVLFTHNRPFQKLVFINSITGYVDYFTPTGAYIRKTTDGGSSWTNLMVLNDGFVNDISVLNEDTIWAANPIGLVGGLFRTNNGGANWQRIYGGTGNNPEKIYMINARIGFMSRGGSPFNRTTDGGYNWAILSGGTWTDIYFIDSLTGWKCNSVPWPNGEMKKTTDGGLNWVTQTLPRGGIINSSAMTKFSVLNKDTIWGAGGYVFYGGGKYRGILYRTIDGGNNWLFQIPDTSFGIGGYYKVQFLNNRTGWGFGNITAAIFSNIHTTNGGDTTFLVGLRHISNEISKEFKLYQNYPNPFNPITKIKYQISKSKFVVLKIFELEGREMITLVKEKQNAGTYEVDFSGYGYSSGVYFYTLYIDNYLIDTKKMILIK